MATGAPAATLGIGNSPSKASWTSDDPHLSGATLRNGPSLLLKQGLRGTRISKA
jgi:hypothetical protein